MEQDQAQPTATKMSDATTVEELVALNDVLNAAAEAERLGAQAAVITQKEWDLLRWRVWDTHRAITELEAHLKPALAHITSGNFSLGSMLFGGKGKK